jgi:hypothetical protein
MFCDHAGRQIMASGYALRLCAPLGLLVREHRMRQFDDFGPDRFTLGDKARVKQADDAVRLALGLLPQPLKLIRQVSLQLVEFPQILQHF